MTTIVYQDGIIACDSRKTSGPTILDDNIDKIISVDGTIFAIAGDVPIFEPLIDMFFEKINNVESRCSGSGIAYHEKELYIFGYHEYDGFWKHVWEKHIPYTLGSGRDHALTALDMGCTPTQAVKMAMKRDVNTGGRIKKIKLW